MVLFTEGLWAEKDGVSQLATEPHPADPRHWHTRAGLGALWLVSRLPWSLQRLIASVAGWLAFHFIRVRRRVVETNLRLCFPELSEHARQAIALAHYQSLALGILEVARCWWRPPSDLPTHHIEGLDLLRKAAAGGKGVLLVSGHFTTLEITGRMLTVAQSVSCLYRDPNNRVLAGLLRRHRSSWTQQAIEMNDLRGLVKALRAGEIVWYAPDQAKRTAQSELLPFRGIPCITNTSTARLAEMTGAAVLTFYARRDDQGVYHLRISEGPAGIPSGDPTADTLRLVAELERAVEEAIPQYLWVHRRFKARPGMPDPYA